MNITGTYTETSVTCSVCGAKLKDHEVKFLRLDIDFLAHGDPEHLIRVESSSAES